MKPTVLILCTGNSCRSHLAEGILRAASGDLLDVQSAGSKPAGYVHPLAVRVMKELGIDISSHRSKHLNEFLQKPVETVITVCGNADQACPIFPGQVNRHHWGFDDPAHATGTEEEKLAVFRRVRDEIKKVFEAYAAGRKAQLFLKAQPAEAVGCEERAGQAATSFMKTTTLRTGKEDVRKAVREGYGAIARSGGSCCGSTPGSCGSSPEGSESLARHIGYSPEELAVLPEGANMGLSCGNPNALASLRPGEIVLDLGSGGGFDVFIAGRKVGPTGRVIGVDMTAEMLAKARKNTGAYRQSTGLDNVEFRLGEIEHLPVGDASIDVIISNCVINLSPDKPQVWHEIARVLKPGGRVAVSDLALLRPLPPSILESVQALVGCVAGAVLVSETEQMAKAAGLSQVVLNPKSDYINGMVDWQDPLYQQIIAALPAGTKPGDFITSLEVTARKPGNPAELQDTAPCCSADCCETEVDPAPVQSAGRSE